MNGANVRDPSPGNIIPPDRLDPVALNVVDFYPTPNQPGTITGANNWLGTARNEDLRHRYQAYRV